MNKKNIIVCIIEEPNGSSYILGSKCLKFGHWAYYKSKKVVTISRKKAREIAAAHLAERKLAKWREEILRDVGIDYISYRRNS